MAKRNGGSWQLELPHLLSTVLVIAVTLLIGFRPNAGPLAWLAALAILLVYILAISWLGVVVGLAARSGATAGWRWRGLAVSP